MFKLLLPLVFILVGCQPQTSNAPQGNAIASSSLFLNGGSVGGVSLSDQLKPMPASTLECGGVSMNLQAITGPINVSDYLDQLSRNNAIGIAQIPADQLLVYMRNCLFPHLNDFKK